jgi:hypothetical protein
VYAVWVTPNDPDTILVGTTEGVFGTTDGGASWTATTLTHSTREFAYLQEKNVLYAATENQGVYSSDDCGATWQELNDGLGCLNILRIAVDTENGLLFAGTDGSSVWRLDVGLPSGFRADLNDDGIVNSGDFAIFAFYWMDTCSCPDWCQGSDFDKSGMVDLPDVPTLVDYWLRCRSDLNSDRAVNFVDFAIFADNWMDTCEGPDWCQGCDFDANSTVDFVDLRRLLDYWPQ